MYHLSETSVPQTSQKGNICTKICSANTHQQQEGVTDTPWEHRNNTDVENSYKPETPLNCAFGNEQSWCKECRCCRQVTPGSVHVHTRRRTKSTFFQLVLFLEKSTAIKYTEWHYLSRRGSKPQSSCISYATEGEHMCNESRKICGQDSSYHPQNNREILIGTSDCIFCILSQTESVSYFIIKGKLRQCVKLFPPNFSTLNVVAGGGNYSL